MQDLWAALCLVAVLEGLVLFVAPRTWQHMMEQLGQLPPATVRRIGAVVLMGGLAALWWVRH